MRFMQTSKLFTLLPEELVCTPDGMAIDRDGNLILSCPNFADLSMPSCVLKIDKDRNIKKLSLIHICASSAPAAPPCPSPPTWAMRSGTARICPAAST